jgi:murein DD-endopeptidase MepM/ murein hydrolase activator NlpD
MLALCACEFGCEGGAMRLSPIQEARVSVQDLPRTPSLAASLQAAAASRWTAQDALAILGRRATVHLSVLALATAVVAASVATSQASGQPDSAPQAAATDSLAVAVQHSIIARAIPFTAQTSDATYQVRPGDSLTAIAHQVGVSEEALLAYNNLPSSDALSVGQQLRIPDLSKVPPEQLLLKDTAPHDSGPLDPLPPQKPSPELIVHQVQKGESIGAIAAAEGVSEATVLASNNLQLSSRLSIGQTLVIPTLNGRLVATSTHGDSVASLAEKYGSSPAAILAANKLDPKTQQIAPAELVLIPAEAEAAVALRGAETAASSQTAGGSQSGPASTAKPAEPAAEAAAPKAPAAPRPASSPGFIWPVTGYISTYFTSWHNGIDIANALGTPVHAAQAGKVVYSGWDNSGYGYMVRIDHGNGLQTLYGHASKLIAKVGEVVEQGQVIMLLGSTGRSTGPHVHFSIFQGSGYNGLNPLKYLP